MQLLEILIEIDVFFCHFFLLGADMWMEWGTASPDHLYIKWKPSAAANTPVHRKQGSRSLRDCRLASGHLSPDREKDKGMFLSFTLKKFLCHIHLSLFLTNPVTSDFMSEKLQSSHRELSHILLTDNPQISRAQSNKGCFSSPCHVVVSKFKGMQKWHPLMCPEGEQN